MASFTSTLPLTIEGVFLGDFDIEVEVDRFGHLTPSIDGGEAFVEVERNGVLDQAIRSHVLAKCQPQIEEAQDIAIGEHRLAALEFQRDEREGR